MDLELEENNELNNNLSLEKNNQLNNNLNLEGNNLEIKENQNTFLNSMLWKTIDNGIDIGLRYLLPDYIENQVIELKDNLINYGLKEGISKSIKLAIETGRSVIGIATGNFENISQIESAIKNGGIIDSVSRLLDDVIDKTVSSGKIGKSIATIIKNGKDSILNNVEKNIESTLTKQVTGAKNLEGYIENWKKYYSSQDFRNMEKEYQKIEKEIKELVPIENTLNNAKTVETLHNLIKNNENKFKLSDEEIELAKKLSL